MTIFKLQLFGITIAPTYYGLMYALGFIFGYKIIKNRKVYSDDNLDDLVFYIFLGVLLGGRLGYVFFYNFSYYINNIIDIFKIWQGGMSFHGGVIGVIIAMIIFSRNKKVRFLELTDNITSILPFGLGFGRIGNYLNKELLGIPYNGFLAVEKNGIYYFPSPLLEALLEGLVLYFILKYYFKNKKFDGEVSTNFLIWYGIFRFLIEFVRMPDQQIGYFFGFITMGQILSIPMILIGIYLNKRFKNAKQ